MNRKILRKIPLLAVLLSLAAIFMTFSCSLPAAGSNGMLSISLPGAQNSTARGIIVPEDIVENMRYELVFSGPGKTQTISALAGKTITLYLAPGRWHIDIKAFYAPYRPIDDYPHGNGQEPEYIQEYLAGKSS